MLAVIEVRIVVDIEAVGSSIDKLDAVGYVLRSEAATSRC